MKRVIREGTFETNSSSTHSITILSKEDFDRWKNDENLYLLDNNQVEGRLVTREEAIDTLKKNPWHSSVDWTDEDEVNEILDGDCTFTFNCWRDQEYYDTYDQEYTTKSGDQIVIFGYYGRND